MDNSLLTKDWSHTPLGPKEQWQQPLHLLFNLCHRAKSPMCIFWGADHILLFNEAWKDLVGDFSSLGRPARAVFSNQQILENLNQVFRSGEALQARDQEITSNTLSGKYNITYNPVPTETGTGTLGIYAIASKSSSNLKQRLRLAIEAGNIGIWDWDMKNDIVTWSDSLERIHGIEPGAFDGKKESFLEVVHPEDRDRMEATVREAAQNCSSFKIEHRWIRHNGEVIWMKCKGRAYPDESGKAELMTGISLEITDRKQNEYTNALLGAIVDGSDDAIISKNLDGVITSWNPGAERIFGYSEQEAVGQNITMLIPDDRLEEEQRILAHLKRGERVNNFETVRKCKDGKNLDISLTISPVYDKQNQIVGASKIARDITKRKQAERRLKEVNDTLEERVKARTQSLLSYQEKLRSLASRLNKAEEQERHRLATELHDNLGQMLAVAKMKVNSLQAQFTTDGEADELNELLDDALIYTRDLMSDLKPPPSLHKENIHKTFGWLAHKMQKHNLKVTVDGKEEDLPDKMNEETRIVLLQCVRELLFNVIKHAGVNEARVSLSSQNGHMQVVVEDKGDGFDTTSNKKASSDGGFGLFNISERIDLLGGSMDIRSVAGKGTEVMIQVPMDHK